MGEFNVNKSDGSLEQTAGMPSEYPASQVMLSDGVTSVQDRISEVNYLNNTAVNIATANASNPYIAPKDGYVRWADTSRVELKLGNSSISVVLSTGKGTSVYESIFVKAGTSVFFDTTPTSANFIPLQ